MAKIIDLTNQRFGRLLVLEKDNDYCQRNNIKKPVSYWKCKCDCGTEKSVAASALRKGETLSCGCLRKEKGKYKKDYTGKKFGKITVLGPTEKRINKMIVWSCKCECGTFFELTSNLIETKYSCGCILSHAKDLTGLKFGKLLVVSLEKERTKFGHLVWKCKCDCGNYKNIPSPNLISGQTKSCGCIRSRGEEKISQILNKYNIPFIQEYSFPDCLSEKGVKLRFDFYVDNKFLLEFDGRQHYYPGGFFNQEDFEEMKQRDKIKNDYCKKHNILLKRIPYWDLDVLTFEKIMGDKYLLKGE